MRSTLSRSCASWPSPAGKYYWKASLFLLLCFGIVAGSTDEFEDEPCQKGSPLVGFRADLEMLQHQLRGSIEVLDDCSFKVTGFDMIGGKEVYWWGAQSDSLQDMLQGQPVNKEPLIGTFNGQTMTVELENTTWNKLGILAVWSQATASDYGHIKLDYGNKTKKNNGDEETKDPEGDPDDGDYNNSNGYGIRNPPPVGNITGTLGTAKPPSLAVASPLAPGAVPSPSPMAGPSPRSQPLPSPSPPPPAPEKLGRWQPTMFDNCMQLSHRYRVRWTLNLTDFTVDIGLEAAVGSTDYLGFGWPDQRETIDRMMYANLVIAGFDVNGDPFAEDYYVSSKEECNWDTKSPKGVCPDSFFSRGNSDVNNVKLIHGQRIDDVTMIRFRVNLVSQDLEYDHPDNLTEHHSIIWAIGSLRPPDSRNPHMTPINHGMPEGEAYGMAPLNLVNSVDDCQNVLVPLSPNPGLVLVADRGSEFVITSAEAVHYPNPPSPGKSLFVNDHEAPVLKVERGVPVQFSVQAGHDVPFYITSDPIGGKLNNNEVIYAGGVDAHGVRAVPYNLTWTPNSSTPDVVFYQSYEQPKMGWQVQVVDGGLSDMYANSVSLADNKVTLFWTLRATDISFAVRGERPSGYLGLAFGSGMVNSFAYVGWMEDEVGKVATYYIDARDADGVHNWTQELTLTKCLVEDGRTTFEFSRALKPSECGTRCNVIDPQEPLKVLWCMGSSWTEGTLTSANMHSAVSSKATIIDLQTGAAEVEMLQPVFAVHGFMMFIAWGILMPSGVLSARYLRSYDWFRIHVYTQCSGIAVAVLGLLFAMGELQGFDFSSTHSKIGLAAFLIGLWQPINAYFRPLKGNVGDRLGGERIIWQWIHMLSGRIGLGVAALALVSGLLTLENKYGGEGYTVEWLAWGILGWFLLLGGLVVYLERQGQAEKSRENETLEQGWSSADWRNGKPDDVSNEEASDLLQSERNTPTGKTTRSPLRNSSHVAEFELLQITK